MPQQVPDDAQELETPPWKSLFYFTERKDIPLLVLASLCSMIAAVATPAQAYVTGKVFDGFISLASGTLAPDDLLNHQRPWILWLVGIACLSWLFHTLDMALWMIFGETQAKNARTKLFRALSSMEIAWFDVCEDGIDVLLPRLGSQITDLQTATSQPLGGVLALLSTVLSALGQAFYNSWDLTLVTLAGSPLIIVAIFYFGIGMQKAIDKQQSSRGTALKHSLSALLNIEAVKCFNAQELECKKYMAEITVAGRWYCSIAWSSALQMGILAFLVQSMFVQAFFYGGILIRNGKKKPSQVITTFFSAITAFQALQGAFPQLVVLEKGRYAGRALRVTMPPANETPNEKHYKPLSCRGTIRLEAVTFRYPFQPDRPALDDINLELPGGHLTFLMGRSGSGKSTIGQLLVKFYDVDAGRVLLDGEDLLKLDPQWLRSNVTLVEQTSTLFDGSIMDNIRLAKAASREDTEAAIEFALLQRMLADMPNGADTLLGASGQSVSGGQQQRIALARARLRDTQVLILDESTSALDQVNRELMMDAIRKWRHGRTTIVITHDISQIREDDYAVVLEYGKVVQQGYSQHMESLAGSPFAMLSRGAQIAQNADTPGHLSLRKTTPPLKRPTSFLTAASVSLDTLPFGLALGGLYRTQHKSTSPPPVPEHESRCRSRPTPQQLMSDGRTITQRLSDFVQIAGSLAVESRTRGLRRRLSEKNAVEEEAQDRPPTFNQMLVRMWHELGWHSRLTMLLGYWAGTLHAACSPVFAYVLAKLLSLYSSPEDSTHMSIVYSLAILGIAAVDAVHTFMYRYLLEQTSQEWVNLLRKQVSALLLDQPQEFFETGKDNANTLAQTLDYQAEEMRNLFGRFLVMLYIAVVILVIAFCWALSAQWKMTLTAISAAPYIFVVATVYTRVSEKWERLSNNAALELNTVFAEAFGKIRTVRSLTLEGHFARKFMAAVVRASQIGKRRAAFSGFFYGMSTSAGTLGTALVFYMGTKVVQEGAEVPSVVQVFAILILTISNVTMILDYVPQMGSAKEMAQRVLRLSTLPAPMDHFGDTRITSVGLTEFRRMSFAYPTRPKAMVLKDININFKPGITTAIVGGSGSGKSTIAKLLLKLYRPSKGRLVISGRDLTLINTRALREVTAVVAQASPLLGLSIKDNIVYGLPSSSPYLNSDDIARAAMQAGIHDFVYSLPNTYATLVGPGGIGLSGGQVQRIAIARALVRRPSLLILDEATSALDPESAALVRTTILELIRSRDHKMTIIMITHNREMMEIADQVVVLDQGCVVETGSFGNLIDRHGHLVNLLQGGAIE